MQEQIVGFEVAKLAKEKGFNWMVISGYGFDDTEDEWIPIGENSPSFINNRENNFAAPTQSFLHKWIREKYNIDVVVGSTYLGYNVVLWNRNTYKLHHISPVNIAEKYEEVLEIGLMEALKLINNEVQKKN